MKVKVSVGVIIHNEEKTLDRCLHSFYDIVDEIIVVHDGPCSDDSLNIAKKYTKHVFVREWTGSGEGHYKFVQEKARNDWMMIVDGDEYFSDDLREHLGELILDKHVNCYDVYWPTYYGNRKLSLGLDRKFYKRVLFRKKYVVFEGYLHEKRQVKGLVKKTEYALIHRPPHDIFSKEYLKKKSKWANTAARMMESAGKATHSKYYYLIKAPFWFIIYLFYYLILRMYFLSGVAGVRYSLTFAKYNYNLNIAFYNIKKNVNKNR